MSFFQLLYMSAGPLALRIMAYLGFGFVSFLAVKTAFAAMITAAQSHWSAMPAAVLQLASLAGIPQGLGLILGAQVARLAIWVKLKGASWIAGGGRLG